MKKFIALVLTLVCVLGLIACGTKEQAPSTPNATVSSVMYEGMLYKTTGKQISAEVDESAIVGYISSVVPLSQFPSNEGEANFGKVGDPYALTADGLLVLLNNEWTLFELLEAETISYDGKEYDKSQLCNATLEWLELSEKDRMLSSYFPPEFMIFDEKWGGV